MNIKRHALLKLSQRMFGYALSTEFRVMTVIINAFDSFQCHCHSFFGNYYQSLINYDSNNDWKKSLLVIVLTIMTINDNQCQSLLFILTKKYLY